MRAEATQNGNAEFFCLRSFAENQPQTAPGRSLHVESFALSKCGMLKLCMEAEEHEQAAQTKL